MRAETLPKKAAAAADRDRSDVWADRAAHKKRCSANASKRRRVDNGTACEHAREGIACLQIGRGSRPKGRSAMTPQSNAKERPQHLWMWSLATLLAFAIGGVLSWLGYLWLIPLPEGEHRFSLVGEHVGGRGLVLYVVMVLGMLSHGVHDYIQTSSGVTGLRASMRRVVFSKAFLSAMLVSPLVFFTVYNATSLIFQPPGLT